MPPKTTRRQNRPDIDNGVDIQQKKDNHSHVAGHAAPQARLKRKASQSLDNGSSSKRGSEENAAKSTERTSYPDGLSQSLKSTSSNVQGSSGDFRVCLDNAKLDSISAKINKLAEKVTLYQASNSGIPDGIDTALDTVLDDSTKLGKIEDLIQGTEDTVDSLSETVANRLDRLDAAVVDLNVLIRTLDNSLFEWLVEFKEDVMSRFADIENRPGGPHLGPIINVHRH